MRYQFGDPRTGASTVPQHLAQQARLRPDAVCMREKRYGIWRTYSWSAVQARVSSLAAGLLGLDVTAGARVAILGTNRPELYWATHAVQCLRAIPIPLYADATSEELEHPLANADVEIVFAEDQEQVDKLLSIKPRLLKLRHIVYVDAKGLRKYDPAGLVSFDALIADSPGSSDRKADVARSVSAGQANEIGVICYTSGTTGRPKGVILTHASLLSTAAATAQLEQLTPRDSMLAYLPMAWIGDHFFSHVQASVVGFSVNFPESQDTLMSDLQELGPTYLFAPPRIFESLLTDIHIRMENAGAVKAALFRHFLGVAQRDGQRCLDGKSISLAARLQLAMGEFLVFGPLKNTLGLRRIKVAYTAGEALSPGIFDFYRSLGVNLKQVYGQTESSVYVCVHRNGDVRSDTVGPPAPSVEVKIAEDGELLYRGPGVFQEYLGSQTETSEVKQADGWVRSGDAGIFTADGHVKIVDRAKDVGRLNTGELFAPKYIENRLKFSPYIKEAVAFGASRDGVVAVINIELEAVGNWAERNGIAYTSYAHLASLPQVYDLIGSAIEQTNRHLGSEPSLAATQIRQFLILHKELDADDGELTRTRKLRRRVIAERYRPLIDALYGVEKEADIDIRATLENGRELVSRARLRIARARTEFAEAG